MVGSAREGMGSTHELIGESIRNRPSGTPRSMLLTTFKFVIERAAVSDKGARFVTRLFVATAKAANMQGQILP